MNSIIATRRQLARTIRDIDNIEAQFKESYAHLSAGLQTREDEGSVLGWQSRIAKSLKHLSDLNHRVSASKRALIAPKEQSDREAFLRAMRLHDKLKKSIRALSTVGQMIGDAFAWIFYRDSNYLLLLHSRETYQPFIPPGIGGNGEIEFIEALKALGKYFVLYHGITSILRMGDFSLIDLDDNKVVAIGDIKSSVDGGKLMMTAGFTLVAEKPEGLARLADGLGRNRASSITRQRQHRAEHKLVEQNAAYAEALGKSLEGLRRSPQELRGSHEKISAAFGKSARGLVEAHRIDDDVGIVVFRSDLKKVRHTVATSFKDSMVLAESITPVFVGLLTGSEEDMIQILPVGRDDLEEIISGYGIAPLYWSGFSKDLVEELIFRRSIMWIVWNQATFMERAREQGWEVVRKGKVLSELRRRVGERMMVLGGVEHFVRCLVGQGYSTGELLSVFGNFEAEVRKVAEDHQTSTIKIELLLSPPTR